MARAALFSNRQVGGVYAIEDMGRSTGNRFYVDSGAAGASDSVGAGKNPDVPFATLDYAIGQCTASNGDIIYLMPGHVEDLASGETIDADVAGISIIGLGNGPDRPRIDYNHASATFDIGANGVTIENVTFRPSVATVTIGIDIEAGVTYTTIRDCEALPGEEGDGTDEFAIWIDLKAGCTRTTIEGCRYAHHASADGAAHCVKLTGASDLVTVKDCVFEIKGTAAVACIGGITTLSTRMLIDNCVLTSDAEPGIELLTGTTGVIRNTHIFTDLATIDAATVADGMAHFDVKYTEVGNEAGTLVKTESADD